MKISLFKFAFFTLLACLCFPSIVTPAATNGKIAFTSNRTGNDEIFVMNADGSGQTNITNNPAHDTSARWSPDGRKISFMRLVSGQYQSYIMNADGSNQVRLTTLNVSDTPSLSPDGTKLVFSYANDIYSMNGDGTNLTQLTANLYYDAAPSFSPDGTRILFLCSRPYDEVPQSKYITFGTI